MAPSNASALSNGGGEALAGEGLSFLRGQAGTVLGGQTGTNINSPQSNFTVSLTIAGDLTVKGITTTVNTETLEVEDNIIRVNKYKPQDTPALINGGLEVFRGGKAKNA